METDHSPWTYAFFVIERFLPPFLIFVTIAVNTSYLPITYAVLKLKRFRISFRKTETDWSGKGKREQMNARIQTSCSPPSLASTTTSILDANGYGPQTRRPSPASR